METNDKKIRNTRIIAVTALIIAVASLLMNIEHLIYTHKCEQWQDLFRDYCMEVEFQGRFTPPLHP